MATRKPKDTRVSLDETFKLQLVFSLHSFILPVAWRRTSDCGGTGKCVRRDLKIHSFAFKCNLVSGSLVRVRLGGGFLLLGLVFLLQLERVLMLATLDVDAQLTQYLLQPYLG